MARAASPTGAFSQKMNRQPTVSVSTPPSIGPKATLDAAANAHAAVARARSAGNAAAAIANPCGSITAAASPWPARAASSAGSEGAAAHSSDIAANAANPIRNSRRRPNRSPTDPAVSSTAAKATL